MRNFIPVRYGTVFLQNPGIPVFFGTVLTLYFHPMIFWELFKKFSFFCIEAISDQFREFPQLLPKKKISSSQSTLTSVGKSETNATNVTLHHQGQAI